MILDGQEEYALPFGKAVVVDCRAIIDSKKQTNFKKEQILTCPVPLPPLSEQHAIVERVDKIMTMINELVKQVTERKSQSEMLMESVLREAFKG